jgi:3-isopropylmalate dehydrogenase
MVKNPEHFEVVVATNLFGDIITDLGAILQGGMGIAAGGNINPAGVGMFEPIHGSAPKHAGKNVANPLATICAVGMLMEHIGKPEIAKVVNGAVEALLSSGKIKDMSTSSGIKTTEYGEMVRKQIAASLATAK